jgi:group II intron reverse transcriptase/maturase
MRKRTETGVGQLVLQIAFPEGDSNNAAGETQVDDPPASSASSVVRSEPERKHKWYSLIDKVYALPNVWKAWQHVKANHGAPGIDRQTIDGFEKGSPERVERLCADLRNKSYRPQPVRRKLIPKSGGGQRPLGIPTVRDRIVQQALLQVLEPIFEAKFSNRSHGFRKERGCHTALDVVDRAVRCGYQWVVDADIRAFFDTVDHDKLLSAVNEEVSDGSVLRLIGQILTAGVVEPFAGDIEPTELGTPQGGPLSPLLANIYLHRFDERMVAAGCGLVRYADDFVLFARSEDEATQALTLAREVLEGELGLALHPEKTRVVSVAQGFEFLGFHYFRDPKADNVVKEVRRKSAINFREQVRKRTPRLKTQRRVRARNVTPTRLAKNQRVGEMIRSLNRYLAGWHGYFRTVWSRYPESPFRNFDGFVRRRVRTAITGRVGPGWWHVKLSNIILRKAGLIPLAERQQKYHARQLAASARKG